MTFASIVFTVLALVVIGFQIALGLGAPLGKVAMGGIYPGKFPTKMRIAAFIQAIIILLFIAVVFIRTKVVYDQFYDLSRVVIWVVVAFFVLGTIMNLMTKSKWERILWAPVNTIMLMTSIIIALN